jgi:hypothetical protein
MRPDTNNAVRMAPSATSSSVLHQATLRSSRFDGRISFDRFMTAGPAGIRRRRPRRVSGTFGQGAGPRSDRRIAGERSR